MTCPPVDERRSIPAVDALLAVPECRAAIAQVGRSAVVAAVRGVCEQARQGKISSAHVTEAVVAAVSELQQASPSTMAPVLNATGVIVHTNLGRAPLSSRARAAVQDAAGACAIEYDLASGRRGPRGVGARQAFLERIAPAEDVHIVNNCAAAVMLVTCALGAGRDVLVSRGEIVEIGDGFRVLDIVAAAGATVREVGTTNRTHLRDYEQALGSATGFVLKVHPSNFTVEGFVAHTSVAELSSLGLPVVADVGSGLLEPHPLLPREPDVSTTLQQGADLVLFSGDKLLGGPQCGVIAGRADLVQRVRRHPLARSVRVDKLTMAAVEATVTGPPPPVRVALEATMGQLRQRCLRIVDELGECGRIGHVVESVATVGGGGAPGVRLPSVAVALPEDAAAALRSGPTPVVARVENGRTLVDVRCIPPERDGEVAQAIIRALGRTRRDATSAQGER